MPNERALLTDLYQLTMAQTYFALGMHERAAFELSVRRLPAARRFLVAGGLEQVLDYLEQWHFSDGELEYLATCGLFREDFLHHLRGVRFTGDLEAMAEGTAFFAEEPVLCIHAPLIEAQLIESRLVNLVHYQSLVASKAVRCVLAAGGRASLIDFGMRRAHGAEAALLAARAAYLAGFDATATVEAGRRFGIPLSGTMAHAFIQAHDREADAFRRWVEMQPTPTTLLIDTYDTLRAAHWVVALCRERIARGLDPKVHAVRIDSGDLGTQARRVRQILDEGGCSFVRIVLSGNLNEYRVQELGATNVPADAFGIGTDLAVSADAPALDMVYKLVEYAGKPRCKTSSLKHTWPGRKQVFRERDAQGRMLQDHLVLIDEEPPPGAPLLEAQMRAGRRIGRRLGLQEARHALQRELAALPPALRALDPSVNPYPVSISARLEALARSFATGAVP